MRFGIFGSAESDGTGAGFRDYVEYCVEAEALGFHSTFLVEHHFTGWNQVSATLLLQTCVAMRTTTLRLGTAVIVLPWHNPVLLAEQAATLDVVSGGRLDLGVGKGYRHNEFAGFAVPVDEADARFDEALDVLVQSWRSRTRFSHRGRFWRFDDVVVEPPPAQHPHPPLWAAAASDASIRRAAARGLNLLLDQYAAPETIGERIALYRAGRDRDFDPMQVAVARQVYVAKDRREAQTALTHLAAFTRRTVDVSRAPGGDVRGSHVLAYPGATESHALYGTPDDVRRGLEALARAGAGYVVVNLAPGSREQLRRFARDVAPAFAAS